MEYGPPTRSEPPDGEPARIPLRAVPYKYVHPPNISIGAGGVVTVSPLPSTRPLRENLIQLLGLPLRQQKRFYVMRIEEIDTMQYVMFGVCRKCWPNSTTWDVNHAIRYHSNDGGVFNGTLGQRSNYTYTIGDTITCRVAYLGRSTCLVEFLKNTQYVFRNWVYLPDTELRATVGFAKTTAKVTVEWPDDNTNDLTVPVKLLTTWMGIQSLVRSAESDVVKVEGWDPKTHSTRVACLTAPRPFSRKFNYFEIEILSLGDPEEGSVGIGHVPPFFNSTHFPGWPQSPRSVGYHSDDGGLHHNGKVAEDDAHKCKAGDVMGCGVVFSDVRLDASEQEGEVVTTYFTKNGSLIYERTSRIQSGGCYPCVTFHSCYASVKIFTNSTSKVAKEPMARALNTLDVSRDLTCGALTAVIPNEGWLCSVESKPGGDVASVQMTSWPLEDELQRFSVSPTNAPSGQVLVGVAEKIEAADGPPRWLCHYDTKSGKIFTQEYSRLTPKHDVGDGEITCMVDYRGHNKLFVTFLTKHRILGRAAFKADEPVYATVALTGAGDKAQVDWTGILFPPSYRDPLDPPLSQWLAGDENKIQTLADKPESRLGRATSMQCPAHFTMSLPYVQFNLNASRGQLPAVGVSSADSDLYSLVGERTGEISYDVVTGEVIINNEIVYQLEPETSVEDVQDVGVGVVFTKPDMRETQDVVVYFTRDKNPVYQRVMTIAEGGAYPTLTFPPDGCEAEVVKGVYPNLPDHMMTAWVDNMKTNVQQQDANKAGTFSTFTGGFSRKFSAAATTDSKDDDEEKKGAAAEAMKTTATAGNETGTTRTFVKDEGTVIARGKLSFNKDGEAVVLNEDGKQVPLVAYDKQTLSGGSPANSSPAPSPDAPANSKNAGPTEEEAEETESAKSFKASESTTEPRTTSEVTGTESGEPAKDNTSTTEPRTTSEVTGTESGEPAKDNTSTTEPRTTSEVTGTESGELAKDNTSTTEPRTTSEVTGTESVEPAKDNTSTTEPRTTSEVTGTESGELAKDNTSTTEPRTTSDVEAEAPKPQPAPAVMKITDSEAADSKDVKRPTREIELFALGHQGRHTGYNASVASSLSSPSPSPPPPPSSASPRLSSATRETEQERKDASEREAEEEEGGMFQLKDDVRDFAGVTNLLMDPSIVAHEQKLRNKVHIEALSESEAKKILQTINEERPREMTEYLSPYDMKLLKNQRTHPTNVSARAAATSDRQNSSLSSSTGSSLPSSRASFKSQRTTPSSRACLLS